MQWQGIIYGLIISFLLTRILTGTRWFRQFGFSNKLIWLVFTLRFLGTVFQQAIYTYYYTDRSKADVFKFYDDGIFLSNVASSSFADYFRIILGLNIDSTHFHVNYFDKMNSWLKPFESGFYNDNHIMIRLNSIFSWVSGGYYEVSSQIFTFLGLCGIFLLIAAIIEDKKLKNRALLLIGILPSSILWLVGSLKETVLIFGLGLFLFGALEMMKKKSVQTKSIIVLIVGVFILIQIKIYFLLVLIPVMAAYLFNHQWKLSFYKYVFALVFFGSAVLLFFHLLNIDISETISRKQHEFISHMEATKAGSAFEITPIQPSYLELLWRAPIAALTSLIRPFAPSGFGEILMVLENIIFVSILAFWFKDYRSKRLTQNENALWILPLAIILLALIGLTTPVFGAIMRYRAPILLLLVLVFTPANFKLRKL